MKRNKFPIFIMLGATILSFFLFQYSPSSFANYNDVMNSGLAFAAIGSAILVLGLSFFPYSKKKSLVGNVYNKILESIIWGTIFYFVEAGLSLVGLFFSSESDGLFSRIFVSIWIGIGISCVIVTINILRMILKEISSSLEH
ncbi:hypothetical protein [Enterococcus casseliflavus]|uniref:hypothetical protein n=1 Tax=Enterococcus casseliflavus TaxID=37734 RepID=UPI00115E26C9|nr:hypothetical protein [Enterococcus casseliflavus]